MNENDKPLEKSLSKANLESASLKDKLINRFHAINSATEGVEHLIIPVAFVPAPLQEVVETVAPKEMAPLTVLSREAGEIAPVDVQLNYRHLDNARNLVEEAINEFAA